MDYSKMSEEEIRTAIWQQECEIAFAINGYWACFGLGIPQYRKELEALRAELLVRPSTRNKT